MDRRGFLSALITAGVAAAADPDRLLWVPGKKLISIPNQVCVIPAPHWYLTLNGKRISRVHDIDTDFSRLPFGPFPIQGLKPGDKLAVEFVNPTDSPIRARLISVPL